MLKKKEFLDDILTLNTSVFFLQQLGSLMTFVLRFGGTFFFFRTKGVMRVIFFSRLLCGLFWVCVYKLDG
jgi:hypothetical protein